MELSTFRRARNFMYLSAACTRSQARFLWDRINRGMARVRACKRLGSCRNLPWLMHGRQPGHCNRPTASNQTAGQERGARDRWNGGGAHLSNNGLGHGRGRVLTGRHEEGKGAHRGLHGRRPWLFGRGLQGKLSSLEAVCLCFKLYRL